MFFNVFDDEVGAGEVVNARRTVRVVHGVRHVPHEGHVFSEVDLLTDGERSAQHAHIEVHPAENDVLDSALLEEIPCLLAVVGQCVAGEDFEGCDLAGPWGDNFAFFPRTRAPHVGIVDGQGTFMFAVRPAPVGSPAFG